MSGRRIALPGFGLSVDCAGVWSLASLPPLEADRAAGLGAFLVHGPTRIQLNVRRLDGWELRWDLDLEHEFARYAEVSWPGAQRSVISWCAGRLRGVTGAFEGAMLDAVVREWVITDGSSVANAATFASTRQWQALLPDCESLVRSLGFDGPLLLR